LHQNQPELSADGRHSGEGFRRVESRFLRRSKGEEKRMPGLFKGG
jgi:hypothetical protein